MSWAFPPDGWPQMALDPVRQILFVVIDGNDLAIYDVGADTLDEMTGSPFNVRRDYPEDGSHIFQIFSPRVDPWSARFFAERQQGGQSELIAYRYDEHVPTDGATYSEGASMGSMRNLSTALDMGTDFRDRQVPLDSGPNPLPDPHTGEVMVVTKVEEEWGVVSLNASLQPGGQCTDEDGPFCTLRNWEEGEPLGALGSNGTACIDAGRRTVSATTSGQFGGGTMQFFRYDAEGDLSAWLGESGSPLPTIETPYNAVCH